MSHSSYQYLDTVVTFQELRLKSLLDRYRSEIELVQSRTNMRKQLSEYYTNKSSDTQESIARILRNAVDGVPSLESLTVYSIELDPVATTDPNLDIHKDHMEKYAFSHRQIVLVDFVPYLNDSALLRFVAPLEWEDEFVGYVLIQFSAESFIALTEHYEGLGNTGETGIAMKINDNEFVSLTRLRHKENNLLNVGKIYDKGGHSPIRRALLGFEEIYTDHIADYRSIPVFATTRYLDMFGKRWGLVVKLDKAEALADFYRFRFMLLFTLFGGLTAIALIVGISMMVSEGINDPPRK